MSGLKAIRRRLSSVKNTKQITRAMKLVSAAKLKRAQDAALGGRKFSIRLSSVLETAISQLSDNVTHPLTEVRDVKRRAYVVFSGERGLCGAYNTNIAKLAQLKSSQSNTENIFFVVGRRSDVAAKRYNWNVKRSLVGLHENPANWPLNELGTELVELYESKAIDEVVLIYTKFITTMNLEVTEEKLLPFAITTTQGLEVSTKKVKLEPSATEVFSEMLPLVLKTKLFQAAFESKACEHAARMTSMDSATRNANELIDKLLLFYNRARQRAITAELLDILGGAEAQKS
jgi:F-type H+-transporting ATPase subunit gamma